MCKLIIDKNYNVLEIEEPYMVQEKNPDLICIYLFDKGGSIVKVWKLLSELKEEFSANINEVTKKIIITQKMLRSWDLAIAAHWYEE